MLARMVSEMPNLADLNIAICIIVVAFITPSLRHAGQRRPTPRNLVPTPSKFDHADSRQLILHTAFGIDHHMKMLGRPQVTAVTLTFELSFKH
jgi:hypothetical protein